MSNRKKIPMCACGRCPLPPSPLAPYTGAAYATRCTLCEAEGRNGLLPRKTREARARESLREEIFYNEQERMRMLRERGENPVERSCSARAQLTVIQAMARVERSQLGYWSDLAYDQGAESAFKLRQIISDQGPRARGALAEWGREQGIA